MLLQTVWLSFEPASRVIDELPKTITLTRISAAGTHASVIACKTKFSVVAVSGVPYILNCPWAPPTPGVKSPNKPEGRFPPAAIVTLVISTEALNITSSKIDPWQASIRT